MLWDHNSLVYMGDLRRQGLSGSQIARVFGVTRNAVIGAWTRHPDIVGRRTDLDALIRARTDAIIAASHKRLCQRLDRRDA